MKGITIIIALALAAAPVAAQDTVNQQAEATTQAPTQPNAAPVEAVPQAEPDPGEQVICRPDRATGSLTRVNRICKTRNEWNGVHANTRDNLNDMQRGAAGGMACRQDQMGGC